jgi:hypothetical protein
MGKFTDRDFSPICKMSTVKKANRCARSFATGHNPKSIIVKDAVKVNSGAGKSRKQAPAPMGSVQIANLGHKGSLRLRL